MCDRRTSAGWAIQIKNRAAGKALRSHAVIQDACALLPEGIGNVLKLLVSPRQFQECVNLRCRERFELPIHQPHVDIEDGGFLSAGEDLRAILFDQVELLLSSIDRKTAVGRRDYAILLILARLGLRAGEIKALTLGDLDWQQGLMMVRGKAGRYSQLPLPADVGEAIADYLQNSRPTAESRSVFLRARAPAGTFRSECAIACIVKHALERAGIDAPRKGAHQFRHGLASQMLRQGATLSEIGELLRHRSPQTTAIYAKVDTASLATLALPWPGGAL
jgi:integrase